MKKVLVKFLALTLTLSALFSLSTLPFGATAVETGNSAIAVLDVGYNISYEVEGTVIDTNTSSVLLDAPNYSEEGYQFIGWYNESLGLYKANSIVDVTSIVEDVTFEAVFIKLEMVKGASIKLVQNKPTGLEFRTKYDITNTNIAEKISWYTLIAPLDTVNDEFTIENYPNGEKGLLTNCKNMYYDVEGDYSYVKGSIVNILTYNYARDFVARGFVTVTYADESTFDIYANYDEKCARSIYEVALKAYKDRVTTLDEVYVTDTSDGYYSRFTSKELKIIKSYIDGVVNITIVGSKVEVTNPYADIIEGYNTYESPYEILYNGNIVTISAKEGSDWSYYQELEGKSVYYRVSIIINGERKTLTNDEGYVISSSTSSEKALIGIIEGVNILGPGDAEDIFPEEELSSHKHVYVQTVINPTCTEQGYTEYKCSCGKSYKDNYVNKLEHSFTNYIYNNDATDKKDGTKTATCDYGCGSKYTVTAFGTRLVCDATFSDISVLGSFICENDDAGNNTLETWDIGGTDLGISVNLSNGETLLLFGDTFSVEDNVSSENWRSGVIGKTRDTDLSDNLQLEYFWTSNGWSSTEYAESPLASLHNGSYETTKIYSGGIEIDGAIYIFYFSRHGTSNRIDKNNYGGCIKSVDGGVTWVRVPDLTWVDHSEGSGINGTGLNATTLQKLVNLDIDATSISATQKFNINLAEHEGYHFTQIYPINGNDGYIYIFGRGGYRTSGLKLGRVKIENFETFSAYEYLVGYDGKTPIWSKEIDDAIFIVDEKLSNMSVAYNPYIDQWVMSYLDVNAVEIVVRYSASLYGEWSDKQTLLQNKLIGTQDTRNLYGAYLNEKWVDNNGNFYFVFSRWRDVDMVYRSYVGKGLITKS